MDIIHPQTDRHTREWKNKEATVCLIGPALHHIGFHENTRLRQQTGSNLKEHSDASCWLLQPEAEYVTQTQLLMRQQAGTDLRKTHLDSPSATDITNLLTHYELFSKVVTVITNLMF